MPLKGGETEVGDKNKNTPKAIRLNAQISGEMGVNSVPLAPWADLEKIKAGDEDPLEVVVEVPAGKSRRGWNYRPEALQKIVGEVMSQGLPGFKGHQKAEDVDTQFLDPVTHWVGAKFENGKAYFRGVIDKAATDLKRWIRAKTIRQVSIFGQPKLVRGATGEIEVVDYRPLSIDWTPLNRAGMPTSIVALGEMDSTTGISEDWDPEQIGGEQKTMTLKEILESLKNHMQANGTNVATVAGEMGWQFQDLAQQLGGEQFTQMQAAQKAVGEMAELFGLKDAKPEEVVAAVKAAREAQVSAAKAQHDQLIDKVIGEMVTAEPARPLVKRLLNIPGDADEAAIKKAVGEMLEQPDVKQVISGLFQQNVYRPVQSSGVATQTQQQIPAGLVARKASI